MNWGEVRNCQAKPTWPTGLLGGQYAYHIEHALHRLGRLSRQILALNTYTSWQTTSLKDRLRGTDNAWGVIPGLGPRPEKKCPSSTLTPIVGKRNDERVRGRETASKAPYPLGDSRPCRSYFICIARWYDTLECTYLIWIGATTGQLYRRL